MVMDQNFTNYSGTMSRIKFSNQAVPIFPNPNVINDLRVSDRILNGNTTDNRPTSSQFSGQSSDRDSLEDCDFSDAVLKYINHILMEEDVEDKTCMFQESAALQAAEKSFSDVLGGVSEDNLLVPNFDQSIESPYEKLFGELRNHCPPSEVEPLCPDLCNRPGGDGFDRHHGTVSVVSQSTLQSSYSSSSSNGTISEGPIDSAVISLKSADMFGDNESAMQFMKGVEEARKFLPSGSNLILNTNCDMSLEREQKTGSNNLAVKFERKLDRESPDISRGKKNPYDESMGLEEERSRKQSAVYSESSVSEDMFDKVLLSSGGKIDSDLRKELSEAIKGSPADAHSEISTSGKTRGNKLGGGKSVVDLRTLLTLCAKAVGAYDHKTANELLKQIRQHESPTGDGMQRLAHYFANGLEARMAGLGTQIYASLMGFPTSAADVLKAYHILLAICPFREISNFFANKTFAKLSEKVTSLHIIDFGILYGFQWPCFLQRLSTRTGGPPRVRITGIDLPCPGFRPSERVEETGRRLASYAETFKVPFEFNAIAQKWETIKLEDLKIDKDELLVVNCAFRLRNLLDETVVVNSPRNMVLNLIRKMNPAVFVLGIVNGAYHTPFFTTRFRQALFHYSSLFDMLDANLHRGNHERMLHERIFYGREVMNILACEETARIERPETYKQWQIRNIRAGFKQLPLDKEIVKMARNRVKSAYHKDFVIDEGGEWLLQGWKGRTLYALSSWRPAY